MTQPAYPPIGDTELANIVRRFADARVLVLGDVMLDRYVSGSASRLSPEAPIPVLRPTTSRVTLGGAANVALNIATLGGRVSLVGVVGDDIAGAEVARLLASTPGIEPYLVVSEGRPTTTKTRFMVGVHQLLRLDEETTADIGEATAARCWSASPMHWRRLMLSSLSDYAKGLLTDRVLAATLAAGANARPHRGRRSQESRFLGLSRRHHPDAERARGEAGDPYRGRG